MSAYQQNWGLHRHPHVHSQSRMPTSISKSTRRRIRGRPGSWTARTGNLKIFDASTAPSSFKFICARRPSPVSPDPR
jgi:hypothetical protein